MKRISENERQIALENAKEKGADLTKPIVQQMTVAKAQLEACEKVLREFAKEVEKLWPIPAALKEKYL